MAKRGQPTKQKQTKLAQKRRLAQKRAFFLEHYKVAGFNISEACRKSEISRCMVYEWLEDPTFEQAMENAGEELIDLVELELQKQIKNGSTLATMYFLNNKGKRRGWSQKQEIKHEHTGDLRVEIIDRYQMPDKAGA